MEAMKHCPKCERTLPESLFHKSKLYKDGRCYCCAECRNKMRTDNKDYTPLRINREQVRAVAWPDAESAAIAEARITRLAEFYGRIPNKVMGYKPIKADKWLRERGIR